LKRLSVDKAISMLLIDKTHWKWKLNFKYWFWFVWYSL